MRLVGLPFVFLQAMKNKQLRAALKAYFTCTRAEKHAALLLSGVLILLQAAIWYLQYHRESEWIAPSNTTLKEQHILQTISDSIRRWPESGPARRYSEPYAKKQVALHPFDPNLLDSAGFTELGLSPRQASSLIRYRERCGGFRNKEDLARVKVLSHALFLQWEPYIRIEPKATLASAGFRKAEQATERISNSPINLNTADTTALMSLPLIGSGRARAIVAYRERLGGYIRIAQLQELRAIPDSVYQLIVGRVVCDSLPLRKLRINFLPADSLRHPYLSKQLARLIVNYRDQHGHFRGTEELLRLPLADAEILRKLAPYISFKP